MQLDKENLLDTAAKKETKKRPSLQGPWSAASPSVRTAPKRIKHQKPITRAAIFDVGKTTAQTWDQNLDGRNAYDETLDISRNLNESVIDNCTINHNEDASKDAEQKV
ncbi:hypothetical protein RB195_001610 [Necator americanus]|uniref:Uncharacterized protein n=1 Tax=Necator americanus TaxID=51031 RepID=A0ABR1DGB9_NECAM